METSEIFESRLDLSKLQNSMLAIKNEIEKVILGQSDLIKKLQIALLADGHVLIEGVPGIAKTLAAKLLSRTINTGFSRIQFTPDLMPSDVLGTSIFNPKTLEFEFKNGPIFSNVILIDEINRAPAKTQSALFEVMEERQITMDGVTYKLASPLNVFATQNPIDHEGTYKLPEAQLDRFLFKIEVDYPSLESEEEILRNKITRKSGSEVEEVNSVMSVAELTEYRNLVHEVLVEDNLIKYIAKIVHNTRNHGSLYLGASPRASLAILSSSKALAAINGKDFVTPEDIKEVAIPVLSHRVSITPEKEMQGLTSKDIVKQIIESVEIPR